MVSSVPLRRRRRSRQFLFQNSIFKATFIEVCWKERMSQSSLAMNEERRKEKNHINKGKESKTTTAASTLKEMLTFSLQPINSRTSLFLTITFSIVVKPSCLLHLPPELLATKLVPLVTWCLPVNKFLLLPAATSATGLFRFDFARSEVCHVR